MFSVYQSIVGYADHFLGAFDTLDLAEICARSKGATGALEKNCDRHWLFSGGPDHVGYWIVEEHNKNND